MKLICIAFMAIMAMASPLYAQTDAEKQELLKLFFSIVAECQKEYPRVPDASVRHMLRHETFPVTHDEKCLAGCVLSKGGLVKDGQIVVEGWRRISYAKWNNQRHAEGATESAAICAVLVPKIDDQCIMAGGTLGCIVAANKLLGVPPPDVPQ